MGSPAKFKVGDVVQFAYTLRETEAGKINNVFSDAYTATIREVREQKSLGSWEYLLTYAPGVKGFLTDFFWHEWFLRSMDEAAAEKKKQTEGENKMSKLQEFNIGDRVLYAYNITADTKESPVKHVPHFSKDFLSTITHRQERINDNLAMGESRRHVYALRGHDSDGMLKLPDGNIWWEAWQLKAAPSMQAIREEEERTERAKADKIAADREKALLESIPKIAQSLENISFVLEDILALQKLGGK